MNPVDFLKIAEQFHVSKVEAERRTSIGRSYYALYNQLLAALSSQGVSFEREDSHGRLVYYLINCPPLKARTIGEDLKTLRNHRNDADYDMAKSVNARESEFVYKKACNAVQQFGALDASDVDKIARCIQHLSPYNPSRERRR